MLISSLVFAYVHGLDSFFVIHVISGLLYGYLFIKTERIWPSVVCHAFHNFAVIMMVVLFAQ
ncbi:CPBP family glutamic-type intramembrane protease [Streptococcus dysgalactiae]|uniref:CPBP family intramembrane metalloprotease n=1 Tax=Streptococcus canis TaxID=1329 RepID=A0AAE4Q6V9_STRCB|nr:CPBP family intramembrane metalloprotease [Streptococcus canis]